jgi:heavy metal sensor kinase
VTARLPVRWRLTLGFALAFALLLLVLGVALRIGVERSLDEGIDSSLQARADELRALVAANGVDDLAGVQANRLSEAEESFAQILSGSGELLAGSSAELGAPLIDPEQVADAGERGSYLTVPRTEGLEHRARVLAVDAGNPEGSVVVVGASLEDRDEALTSLSLGLLIAGAIALVVASALGYLLAASALRPVEAMRRRAAEISGSERGARLPVARADDELRALGLTLNSMLQRIDGAMDRERTFVADASHELRTPLAVLQTEIDLALSGERSREQLRTALVSAGEETERLSRLATDLLALARAQDDQLPLAREHLDASSLVAEVAERFSAAAERAGRAIGAEVELGLVLHADRQRLEQALGNLVDNALRHGQGAVRISARGTDGAALLVVSDEGPGIPADLAPRAFERFSRADAGRGGEGTGLGLAIVRAVALAHGGEAEIRSGPPPGVAMTIPAVPENETTPRAEGTAGS